jgi:hypothetical protein
MLRKIVCLRDVAEIGGRIRFGREEPVFNTWLARGPGNLFLHRCRVMLNKTDVIPIDSEYDAVHAPRYGLVEQDACVIQAVEREIVTLKVAIKGREVG